MTIRAVIFDIGGVLVRTEDLEPRRKWERRLGLPAGGLADLVFTNPVARRASVGQASWPEVWDEVALRLVVSPADLAELRTDFWRGDVWDKELIGYLRSLRPRYKTGIISNAIPRAREEIAHSLDDAMFDALLFSYEEGVEKPDPEIYRRALARLDVQPVEAVFVDDMPVNVDGARAVGMHGLHFSGPAKARVELERLGVK